MHEPLHAFFILGLVGVDFRVDTLKVRVGDDSRRAMAGSGDKEGIEVVLFNQAVEVDVGEGLTGIRSPVAK